MSFILCMFCKVVIGDTFVLRTSSMEPTMVGRRSGGDRILLSRLHTEFDKPQRWDVVLFRYPNNLSTHYMKRLVGMGNEIGTLEEGKLADVIVVDGNPLEDITVLQDEKRIPIVIQGGRIVKGGGTA